MKIKVIPAILAKTLAEIEEKIKKVSNLVDWVQLDVADGVFVKNKAWPYQLGNDSPSDLIDIKDDVKLEVHLMVQNPETVLDEWLKVADRIIVHWEATKQIEKIIETVKERNKQIGLAIDPETAVDKVKPFLNKLDVALLMTVHPGWGGQKFEESVIPKIKLLREEWPEGKIEVDGGINLETVKKVTTAGANLLSVGSYIFESDNIEKAINNLTT